MTDKPELFSSKTLAERIATQVVENVCELPDYNSPEDQPDLVMCTVQELEACVLRAFEAHGNETGALRLPDDPQQLLVTTARDAGFSEAQWKAMFYEQGPYDVTFPCFTTKKFIALLLERLQQPPAQKALASLPPCECLIRDKEPSAYHAVRCPRFVAGKL